MVLKPAGEADPESMEVSYRICSAFKKPGLDLEGKKKKGDRSMWTEETQISKAAKPS